MKYMVVVLQLLAELKLFKSLKMGNYGKPEAPRTARYPVPTVDQSILARLENQDKV